MHTERYDFDTAVDRTHDGSGKWIRRTEQQKAVGAVPMSVADMELRCPPVVIDAVTRAAEHGVYGYTAADEPYRDAVCEWMRTRHGWSVEPEWIVPENGIVPALCAAVRAFTEPDDQVLIQSPGYHPFTMAAELNGRVPLYSPLELGEDDLYRMNFDDLRQKAADPRTKMMFLCSPHNPVGRIWAAEELRRVADICRENDVLVVADEIHFDLEMHGKHIVFTQAAPEMLERCIICTAPSKTFNLAGLQLANMIIAGEGLREAYCRRLNADGYNEPSYFGYHATIAAYRGGAPWLDALIAYVRANFDFLGAWLAQNLPKIRLLPAQGTYLAWTDCRALGLDQPALETFFARDALIILSAGTAFDPGGEGFMRWNLAAPRGVLEGALERLLVAARRRGFV